MGRVQTQAKDASPEPFELVDAADDLDLEARVKKLSEDLASVKSDINAIKSLLEEDSKQKTLERALQLVNVGSFTYYKRGVSSSYPSQKLAKEAIEYFLLGSGYELPRGAHLMKPLLTTTQEMELDQRDFRKKFTEQIKLLIRREPRVVHADGKFTIHYE